MRRVFSDGACATTRRRFGVLDSPAIDSAASRSARFFVIGSR